MTENFSSIGIYINNIHSIGICINMKYKHKYLSADIICSEKRTVFREHRQTDRKTDRQTDRQTGDNLYFSTMIIKAMQLVGSCINTKPFVPSVRVNGIAPARKTVSFKEQIMSRDKYPCIFSSQVYV